VFCTVFIFVQSTGERGKFVDELYKKNIDIVSGFLFSQCHDRELTEELTQETFLRAYQSLERFDGSCKISVWLCQIAKHLLYQYWEKQKKRHGMVTSEGTEWESIPDHASDVEQRVLAREELLETLKKMQKLPILTREVIYLRMTAELSFREIGQILGKSETWARVTFFRGKEKLLKEKG